MADPLAYVCAALLAATLAVALIILLSVRQIIRGTLSPEAIGRAMRAECDLVRRDAEGHARAGRGELADNLNGFQTTLFNAFGLLGKQVSGQVREFGDTLNRGVGTIDARVEGMAQKLNGDIAKMGDDAGRGRETLRGLIEAKLDASAARQTDEGRNLRSEVQKGLEKGLGAASLSLATKLDDLGTQQIERLDATRQTLHLQTERNTTALEAMRVTVEGQLKELRQENAGKLEEMRRTVDEKLQTTLEARLGESFTRVVEQLNRVHEGLGEMRNLASNVGDLKSVLTNVKVRGTYGEVQLALILEQFLAPHQFVKDARVNERTLERVEYAVRFPGRGEGAEVLLPIDAKFPRETFERLMEASETGQADAVLTLRKELETQIRKCAKDIRDKYVLPPVTTDFAVMFLPTESLYAEVLRQPGLFEVLQRDYKVTVAGPTTLSALLSALQIGFRTLAIEKRSSEVWQILGAVKNEFGKYNGVVEGLAKQLDTAMRSVEKLGTRTKVLTRTLKNVHDLPDGPTANLLDFDGEEGEAAASPGPVERSGPKLLFSDTAA